MNVSTRKSVMLLLLTAAFTLSAGGAFSSEAGEYMEWAVEKSGEFDRQWESITGPYSLEPVVMNCPRAGMIQTDPFDSPPRYYNSADSKGKLVNSSFMNRGNWEFLPRTSRVRNGATRGTSTLKNPARGNHGVPHTRLRARHSAIERSSNFGPRGSVSRPRLSGFGRVSSSRTRSSVGSYTRGATRVRRR